MTKQFLMNLLLSFIWVALTGEMYYGNFLFGFLAGFFVLSILGRTDEDRRYFTRIPKILYFIMYIIYEIIIANFHVAYDVITPKYFFTPGIIKYKMEAKSDIEINLLSTVISLTPGTTVLDISDDNTTLFIHVMYLKTAEAFEDDLRNGFEKKLLEILR